MDTRGVVHYVIAMSHDAPPDPLIAEVDAFLAEADMSPTQFGRAMGDLSYVSRLRDGRDYRRSTAERARAQIARYRETGAFAPRPRKYDKRERAPMRKCG